MLADRMYRMLGVFTQKPQVFLWLDDEELLCKNVVKLLPSLLISRCNNLHWTLYYWVTKTMNEQNNRSHGDVSAYWCRFFPPSTLYDAAVQCRPWHNNSRTDYNIQRREADLPHGVWNLLSYVSRGGCRLCCVIDTFFEVLTGERSNTRKKCDRK